MNVSEIAMKWIVAKIENIRIDMRRN